MIKNLRRKSNEIDTTKDFLFEEEIDEVEEFEEDTEAEDLVDEIEDTDDSEDFFNDDDSDEEVEEPADDEDSLEGSEDEETDDEDDLFTVKKEKRKPKLEEEDYIGLLTEVLAERKLAGKYGKPWVNIGLKFKIKNPDTGEYVEVTFNANKSLDPKSRLYPIVKGILGAEPGDNFNLKELEGKKAKISIEHRTDSEGNVWDNIVAVRKYIPKKK
ncbi:hypothetical protein EHW71_03535 [Clostridium butyricum]|uniref:hypothetical protein n=1 Tax=Clostridium butyricum TaxID=1492 RepID=UPI000F52EC71|nr:hypothetical protein [Clostridium butyricum]RQN12302.1 hypothetical protein EHW71_03535 [Clostridium butyricum]